MINMVFRKISGDRLKILLTGEDMQRFAITYDQLDYADEQTRKVILQLLEMARMETGFELGNTKLFIEAYPYEQEGCVIYFTGLEEHHQQPSHSKSIYHAMIFEFDQADTLIEGAIRLFAQYSHRIYKSALYHWKKKFYLIVYPFDSIDSPTITMLGEYGKKYGEGEISAAYIREHATVIAPENAIDRLAYFLGDHKSPPQDTQQ